MEMGLWANPLSVEKLANESLYMLYVHPYANESLNQSAGSKDAPAH